MKRYIKSLLLVVFSLSMVIPAWGQASTEGKEFWVALTMASAPSGFDASSFEPFIAISAKKQCKVTVSNPAHNWTQAQRTVQADSWTVIKDIPVAQWYDVNWTANSASESVTQLGIKVEATEEVSVYAAIRMPFSYDASNILPVTALQSDYIIQDYPAYNSQGESHAAFVVLATEDNTTVAITPTSATQKGKAAGTRFTVNLQKGETYQVVSTDQKSFAGTRITAYATNNHAAPKPIAVFQGADFTQIPGGKAARDCLYEQAMPLDYWGTEFVVTRSEEKDANRVRITASDNTTDIYIDGYLVTQLSAGATWEFEMSEDLASTAMASSITGAGREIPLILQGEAHYIKASCPVAVYSYDVSSDYRFSTTTKIGDPSMVWISPLQQRISKITFGACGTQQIGSDEGHTNRHFVNIVCLTSDVATVKLSSEARANIPLTFQTVPGNPQYSYARKFLVDTDDDNPDKVYTLSSDKGIIAHVYGSGVNESYAYSVGSAAVKQGINIEGIAFTDGYIYDQKFCFGSEMTFDANVGTDEITRVDWNFGDGTTLNYGPVDTTHTYTSPGWYDVTATLYGHQVCTNDDEMYLGSVTCSFLVYRPDTLVGEVKPAECISLDDYKAKPEYWDDLIANGKIDTIQENCYDDVVLNMVIYGRETEEILPDKSGWNYVIGYNGQTYTQSTDVVDEDINEYGCTHYRRYHVEVIFCLDMTISGDGQSICPGDSMILGYSKSQGKVKDEEGRFIVPCLIDEKVTISNGVNDIMQAGEILLPTQKIKTPGHYTGQLIVDDANCDSLIFDIHFTVNYPSDIFKFKFNNVLAVYQNKGYEFTNYQWYRNGQIVQDGPSSILYLGEGIPFNEGDIVYVVLTDKSGMVLPSCAQTLKDIDPNMGNGVSNQAPAKKVLINDKFRIIKDNMTFDIYGQRVQ